MRQEGLSRPDKCRVNTRANKGYPHKMRSFVLFFSEHKLVNHPVDARWSLICLSVRLSGPMHMHRQTDSQTVRTAEGAQLSAVDNAAFLKDLGHQAQKYLSGENPMAASKQASKDCL